MLGYVLRVYVLDMRLVSSNGAPVRKKPRTKLVSLGSCPTINRDIQAVRDLVRSKGEGLGGVHGDLALAVILRLGLYTLTQMERGQVLVLLSETVRREYATWAEVNAPTGDSAA